MTETKNTFDLKENWKKIAIPLALTAGISGLAGCKNAANQASHNLSEAAENFEIQREIVFYNTMTNHFFATVNGRCSIEVDSADDQLEVTCKHSEEDYRKHYLGRAPGATYFVLQTEPANVSEFHTRITFNPQGFIPDIDFRGSAEELTNPTRPDTHNQPVPQEANPVEKPKPAATQASDSAKKGAMIIMQGQKP